MNRTLQKVIIQDTRREKKYNQQENSNSSNTDFRYNEKKRNKNQTLMRIVSPRKI